LIASRLGRRVVLAAALLTGTANAASPCDGVDRTLTDRQKVALQPAIAKQLKDPKAEIRQAFRVTDWSIVYVRPEASDAPFLFFKGNPETHRYVTLWAGAAQSDEQGDIEKWVLANAPGIPATLAKCFAYHVTQDRDM
jgi:hypothetical protein